MTTEDLRIRKASIADLESIVNLSREIYGADAHSVYIWRQVLDIATPLTFIARSESTDVGYAVLAPTWEPHRAWFLNLGIAPRFRRKGAGRHLAAAAIDEARSLGIEKIDLTVDASNAPAIRLYENLGFTRDREIADYFGPGEDRLLLSFSTSANNP